MDQPATLRYPITIDGETADVGTAAELAVALDVLHGNHDREVLAQLRPHLGDLVCSSRGLISVLGALAPDDQLYLLDAMGPRLAPAIGSAFALRELFAMLAAESVEERLLDVLGRDALRDLLQTAEDLAGALEWLYGQCDERLLELLGTDWIARIVQSGHDLSLVLHALSFERQGWLLEQLGLDHVAALVHDLRDLAHLLRALPAEASRRLLDHLPPTRLAALVATRRQWHLLARHLEAEELEFLHARLGVDAGVGGGGAHAT